jgi:hypothetical protein
MILTSTEPNIFRMLFSIKNNYSVHKEVLITRRMGLSIYDFGAKVTSPKSFIVMIMNFRRAQEVRQ